jgi:hypothetical protein
MADSLIGFLNQQIQKTNRPQEQQQKQQSTSVTTTRATNAPTHYSSDVSLPNTTSTQSSVYRSLDPQQVRPEQSQNNYPQRFSAQECTSSLGGLGINTTQTYTNNTVVSGAASISSGNVLPIRGSNIYPTQIRSNRGESMLLQQQPTAVHLSAHPSAQSNRQVNMSSSGILIHVFYRVSK